MLPAMVLLTVLMLPDHMYNVNKRFYKIVAVISFAILAVLSLGGTHDYLAWNRARWDALNYLTTEMKVSPANIDGGFEFNGWNNTGVNQWGRTDKSWWFVNNDDYAIAFGKIDNFTVFRKFEFTQYMPYKTSYIYILKKIMR